ncbi:MAG: OFA family MFS transporter [Methanosarcinaceae archaeon]|jgi:OFA family oxalate/formate antiporter-like MFS transporter|nr:OFA family MFS transporter [Methanosarcinaceae archaeon]
MNRWSIPFAGFLLSLMGGVSYAWGVFVVPMVEKFGWTTTEAMLPFTIFMVTFSLVMVPAGDLQDRIGPRKVSFIGAILFFISYGLASLVYIFPFPWWLIITYGIIGGTACGLTYSCVAPPARKWFPDKPGLAISFGVMGFGLAALVLAPLKADYLIPVHGIAGTLFIISILTSIVCLFAAWLIRNPPDNWAPIEWKLIEDTKKTTTIRHKCSPKEAIKSPVFWKIWLALALVVTGGFMAIGLIPMYGEKIIGLTPVESAFAISIFAAFNGFGRPFAGFLSDKYGVLWVMIITYAIQTVTLLLFYIFAVTLPTLYLASALLGWSLAVTLALFPTLTSICFGTNHLGVDYGLIFTAVGVGALLSAIGLWIVNVTESYALVFVFAGILAGMGLILCIVLKKKYAIS